MTALIDHQVHILYLCVGEVARKSSLPNEPDAHLSTSWMSSGGAAFDVSTSRGARPP